MTLARKGLILAAFQCLLVLSLAGKLLYDRSTCPRVWVKTARWDPNLPIRGRYLALRLVPEPNAQSYAETNNQMVSFFVPEHALPLEGELWAEVTIPHKGPPRPIRLALKKSGKLEPLAVN